MQIHQHHKLVFFSAILTTAVSDEDASVQLSSLSSEVEGMSEVLHELLKSVRKLTQEYVSKEDLISIREEVAKNREGLDEVKALGLQVSTLVERVEEVREDLIRRLEGKEKRRAVNVDNYVTYDTFNQIAREVNELKEVPKQLESVLKQSAGGKAPVKTGKGSILRDEFARFQLSVARDTSRLRYNEGEWVVFQRRGQLGNPADYFSRNLSEYVNGFGDPSREFWLGLDKLEGLTRGSDSELRIELQTFEGERIVAEYSSFSVSGSDYRISTGGYQGAGGDPLRIDNNMPFSARDADRDNWSGSCSDTRGMGGWWFNGCGLANLNGKNLGANQFSYDGILWFFYKNDNRSFKASKMMLRRKSL